MQRRMLSVPKYGTPQHAAQHWVCKRLQCALAHTSEACFQVPILQHTLHPGRQPHTMMFDCLQDELYLNGAVVLPHKEIKEAVQQPNIIL